MLLGGSNELTPMKLSQAAGYMVNAQSLVPIHTPGNPPKRQTLFSIGSSIQHCPLLFPAIGSKDEGTTNSKNRSELGCHAAHGTWGHFTGESILQHDFYITLTHTHAEDNVWEE